MRISVVITGMNHENTIMEATESVLSQSRLPDEFGMVIGPSYDQTREFVDFYRDELDFAYFPEAVDPAEYGHGKLRLEVINRLDGDYVLFLPAHSVLYPDALQSLEQAIGEVETSPDLVFASFRILNTGEKEPYRWSLSAPGYQNLLSGGPIHPAMVLYRLNNLRSKSATLETLGAGPFTTLAWILQSLRDHDARAEFIDQAIGESWDEVESSYCWTRSTQRGMDEIKRVLTDMIPESISIIETWESRGPQRPDPGQRNQIVSGKEKDSAVGQPSSSWIDAGVPFVE